MQPLLDSAFCKITSHWDDLSNCIRLTLHWGWGEKYLLILIIEWFGPIYFFFRAALNKFFSQPVYAAELLTHIQDLALVLVEFHLSVNCIGN